MGMSLGLLLGFLGITGVAALLSQTVAPDALPLTLFCCLVGYVFSVIVHPYRDCWWCGGSARHTGVIARYARRSCRRCNGTGRALRVGSWLMGRK